MRTNAKRPKGINKPTITLVTNPFDVEAKLFHVDACGGWQGKFSCAIETQCQSLDEHGFVVEAVTLIQAVREYFAKATYKASCEELALCIVNVIANLVGPTVTAIQVKVISLTGHIRVDWKLGEEVPAGLVCLNNH